MTSATPMMMPSIVKAERNGLARNDANAVRRTSLSSMPVRHERSGSREQKYQSARFTAAPLRASRICQVADSRTSLLGQQSELERQLHVLRPVRQIELL